MRNKISIREWVKRFNGGKYASSDVQTMILAGWYDLFCKDRSLVNKTKRMGNIIKQIKPGGKIDIDNSYVRFNNNCPLDEQLYDDFRISDINSDSTLLLFKWKIHIICFHIQYLIELKKIEYQSVLI